MRFNLALGSEVNQNHSPVAMASSFPRPALEDFLLQGIHPQVPFLYKWKTYSPVLRLIKAMHQSHVPPGYASALTSALHQREAYLNLNRHDSQQRNEAQRPPHKGRRPFSHSHIQPHPTPPHQPTPCPSSPQPVYCHSNRCQQAMRPSSNPT